MVDIGMQNCPGLTKGAFNLNRGEIIKRLKESMLEIYKDTEAYKKYILDKKIKILPGKRDKTREAVDINKAIEDVEAKWRASYFGDWSEKSAFRNKRFVEPLAEIGLLPRHPFLEMVNDRLSIPKRP